MQRHWRTAVKWIGPSLLLLPWAGWVNRWPLETTLMMALVWMSAVVAGVGFERYRDYAPPPDLPKFRWWWGPKRYQRAFDEHMAAKFPP